MDPIQNLTIGNIIELNPIDISTLIISVVVALATVYLSTKLHQKFLLDNSKKGLIHEIKRNLAKTVDFTTKIDDTISKYEKLTKERTVPILRDVSPFEKNSYNYASQNGYLLSFPAEITDNIDRLYFLLDLIMRRYIDDEDYRAKLQDPTYSEPQKGNWEKNRLTNLQNMRELLSRVTETYFRLNEFLDS